jgi:hypothetical protein
MTISPMPPLSSSFNEEDQEEEMSGMADVSFVGLLSHVELDFFRKSQGRGLRLEERYDMFVQRVTPEGLVRLSFRPGVRDRVWLGKQAVLEALAGE